MRTFGLARIRTDCQYINSMGYDLDDARVAATLKVAGYQARLYAGQPSGRIQDLSRQLARMRSDVLLLWANNDGLPGALQVAKGLKALRPNGEILIWGPGSADNSMGDAFTFVPIAVPEGLLAELHRSQLIAALPTAASPYLTGLVAPSDMERLGVSAHQALSMLHAELQRAVSAGGAPALPIPLDASRCTPEDASTLVDKLAEWQFPLSFDLFVNHPLPAHLEFAAARIKRVSLLGEHPSPPVLPAGLELRLIDSRSERPQKARLYGKNGLIALHTGAYPPQQNPGIFHLELAADIPRDAKDAVYQWAAPHMWLRSAAVLTGPTDQITSMLPAFQPPFAPETVGWPKHVYGVGLNANGLGQAVFDGNLETSVPVQVLPYSDEGARCGEPGVLTVLTVRTESDVNALEQSLSRFHATGCMETAHPNRPVVVENTCRWGRSGGCNAVQLRRLTVDVAGNLSPCRDAGHAGGAGDPFDTLVSKQRQELQLKQIERGCATCPVRDECSQCFHLPDAWGHRYCDFRKAYPLTSMYFELQVFPYLLARTLPDPQAQVSLAVSYPGLPARHYLGPAGSPRRGLRPLIVSFRDQHFAWWRGSSKIVRLSAPLAAMAEGWWLGATDEHLVEALAKSFQTEVQVAAAALKEGTEKLQAGGLLGA